MGVFARRIVRGRVTQTTQPNGSITHGEQLTLAMSGWTALGVQQTDLIAAGDPSTRLSNWPGNDRPAWIVETPYVYNNNPSNKGGIVPAGGMMIDGFLVPAGTYVVQFRDFSDQQIVLEGDCDGQYPPFAGLMLRGCRWRGASENVGLISENGMTCGGKVWVHYCDLGGLGSQPAQYCEVAIKQNGNPTQTFRNYISYVTTGIQTVGIPGMAILENYIERLTTFNTDGPHLNGITFNGSDTCAQVERNHIVVQTPEDNGSGKAVGQTDCISFFQDFGAFPGTGQNSDSTYGYRVLDNYIGGTGYCFYAGMNAGQPATSVQNMYVTGNKITTVSWPNGGQYGSIAAVPSWGSYGNVNSNNTWADGASAGQSAF